jgi:hypothetical protein
MKLSRIQLLAGTATAALALAVGAPLTASAASASTTQASASAASAKALGKIAAPVTGTFTNAAGQGTFKGTFTPARFSVVNGVLEATGVLKGTLTSANGTSVGSVSRTVTMNVATPNAAGTTSAADPAATCSVLDLTLGPLNLNLLGLVVTLNQVHLTITAVPGAGNLLGNLLCAVTNLLNGGGLLSTISADLNAILALL